MISKEASLHTKIYRFVKTVVQSGPKTAVDNTISYLETRVFPQSGCSIGQELPTSTKLHHPTGIVIASDADIGENVDISQNVTIGWKEDGVPTIGDNVRICAGAVVIGDILVDDGAVIGANAVVLHDVGKNEIVAGVPAEKVGSTN